jgi:RNA polymerase sigma-70 factor (TIGR02957 family)
VSADLDRFQASRHRLFGLAYRMLGEAAAAEDVVQDAYLRWQRSDQVDVPEAWLTRVVTNLCLNRLTSARARRESYVGSWLPEPVFTGDGPLDVVEQRDSVSLGMLALFERLSPPERAAFVLREAFEYRHREIADVLGIEEPHARQLYRRARERVGAPGRRFEVDAERQREVVERFLTAALQGDLAGLEQVLAEDVVAWSDGGGRVSAARRPVVGRSRVARLLLGFGRHPRTARAELAIRPVNGESAVVVHEDGVLSAVLAPECADGLITAFRTVVNPEKLAFAASQEHGLSRIGPVAGSRGDGRRS